MLIPIPIFSNSATIQGAVWKLVNCEHCQQQYAYLLELEAEGKDYDLFLLEGQKSGDRALALAKQNLLKKSRNIVLPVPCPNCGDYQGNMIRLLKQEDRINSFQIVGTLLVLLSFAMVLLSMSWMPAIILGVTGTAIVAYGYVKAGRWDPNTGDEREARLAIGQRNAIWGTQLAEQDILKQQHVS